MATPLAYDSLKTHLTTAFPAVRVIDFDEIEAALEQSKDEFLCLEEITSLEVVVGIGDPTAICIRELSDFVVHAFTPAPESSKRARIFGEQILQSLRFVRFGNHGRVVEISPPDFEMMNDGLWTAVGIAVNISIDRHEPLP